LRASGKAVPDSGLFRVTTCAAMENMRRYPQGRSKR
jgi:hypothetical protein